MLDFPGTPGTLTGFVLRILQCVFAAGSVASMATALRNRVNGSSSDMEFDVGIVRCICIGKKEDASQSYSCQPLCSWGLGDSNIISRRSFRLRWRSNIVLQRLGTLQFWGRMSKVPNICCFGFPKLDNHSHFSSDYALDIGCRLNTYSYCKIKYISLDFSYICLIFVHFFYKENESRYKIE